MLQLIQDHTDIIDAEVKLWKQETKNGSLNTDNASSSQQNDFNDIFEVRLCISLGCLHALHCIHSQYFYQDFPYCLYPEFPYAPLYYLTSSVA